MLKRPWRFFCANAMSNQSYVTAMIAGGLPRDPFTGRFVSNAAFEGIRPPASALGAAPGMREQVDLLREIARVDKQMLQVQTRAETYSFPRPAFASGGIPTPPWPWASGPGTGDMPSFLRGQRVTGAGMEAAVEDMGGGGGGGYGGGGGRGGGYGGGRIPFAGHIGLAATSRALTGGFEAGIAGLIAEEIAFLPQHGIGALQHMNAAPLNPIWILRQIDSRDRSRWRWQWRRIAGKAWDWRRERTGRMDADDEHDRGAGTRAFIRFWDKSEIR